MIHELKTWPKYFWAVVNHDKTFEVRKNDRNFHVGDRLDLLEYDPDTDMYTGLAVLVYVTYICPLPLLDGYVGMSIESVLVRRLNDGERKGD